jgi:type II secretory pathway pseudopilin PulG
MISKSVKVQVFGISVIEVLVALAVLAIIGAIALPSPQKSTARADMQAAVANLEQSIYLARSTAISTNSGVVMHLVPGTQNEPGKIGFSFTKPEAGTDALDSEYPFPPEIRLETTASEVHFNSIGIVESPTRVALISNLDADLNQRLLIE